jgi:hypothetical protein
VNDRQHRPPLQIGLARLSYLNALDDGNLALLKYRLRAGNVSREEMALAADLLDQIEPHQRKNSRKRFIPTKRDLATMVLSREARGDRRLRKNIIPEIAETFRVSQRHIYDALDEFGDDAVAIAQMFKKLSHVEFYCLKACEQTMRWMIDFGGFDPNPSLQLGKVKVLSKRIVDHTIALVVLQLETTQSRNIIPNVARMFDVPESYVSGAVVEFGDAAQAFLQGLNLPITPKPSGKEIRSIR